MKVTCTLQKVYLLTLAALAFTVEEVSVCLRAVTDLEWLFPLKSPSVEYWVSLIGESLRFWWLGLTLDGSSRKNEVTLSSVSPRRKSGSWTQTSFSQRGTEPEHTAFSAPPPPYSSWLFSQLHLFCFSSCIKYWYGSHFCWQWIFFCYYFKIGFPCNLGWPWTLNPSASFSKVLRI